MIGKVIRDFLPKQHLLSYLEAILRVYNRMGRRDNLYKARIKILVHEAGIETVRDVVEEEWARIRDGALTLPEAEEARIRAHFAPPDYEALDAVSPELDAAQLKDPNFAGWVQANIDEHKAPGYAIVSISLKPEGGIPGDATADQMDVVAELSERYSLAEVRVTHQQNLVLPHVKQADLYNLWSELKEHGLAPANIGLISDIIACPGLDYCALANARSIPIAQRISERFADLKRQHDIGELLVKISGCINACGHHHVGHIGILGVDRRGEEYYQITLGGSAAEDAAVGQIVGPAFSYDTVVDAVETIVETYLTIRQEGERFLDTVRRTGNQPFKEALYATA